MKLQNLTSTRKFFQIGFYFWGIAFCALLFHVPGSLFAQVIPQNIDPALVEQLNKQKSSQGQKVQKSPLDETRERSQRGRKSIFEFEELPEEGEIEPLSLIEQFFIDKIWGKPQIRQFGFIDKIWEKPQIRQFGYENFRRAKSRKNERGLGDPDSDEVPLTGAISDSYVLGIGDDLVVTFQGLEDDSVTVRVDRKGQLILPKLPPIVAAGRTFGELRRDLEARVAATLLGTEVFVSLGVVRVISVYVVGQVSEPGLHRLTSLSTILDALVEAGGVLKTGSLRQIEITRGDRRFLLDTYDLLVRGGTNYDLSLVDGDRIFVPAVSSMVAVAGDVNRPAIYELPYGRPEISVAELLHLSGGTIVPRGNRILLVSTDATGREITQEPDDLSRAMIRGGEYVRIISAKGLAGGVIEVRGHVNNAGARSLSQVPTIGALLQRNEIFQTDPYLYFAALRRADPRTLMTTLIPINLRPILDGEFDVGFQNRDILTVFGIDDIRFIISPTVQQTIRGRIIMQTLSESSLDRIENCEAVEHLAAVLDGERADRFVRAKYFSRRFGELSRTEIGANESPSRQNCPEVFQQSPELLAFLMEHSAILIGEVRKPGVYPLTAGTKLSGLLSAAGGLTVEAGAKLVEISRSGSDIRLEELRDVIDLTGSEGMRAVVGPGDTVRVNAVHSAQDIGPILLEGEILRPGIYNIQRGERLSQIIQRAGGLTAQAFPKGAVFTRETARAEEQKSFQRLANQLQLSLVSNLLAMSGMDGANVGEVSIAAQQLVAQLREATPLGRVVIEADPTALEVDPSLDTILQPGDRLIIPKRPNWIVVSGAVLNPGTVQFSPGSDPKRYISMVGGFSEAADKRRVFVVYPDGRAQPVRTSFWNYQSVQLMPGSSVVVPMDATPFRFLPIAREVTSVLSQLAIAAASLSVISRD